MRVSVVIPSYKRPESLVRCLDALARQEHPADETIVVVRSGDDASKKVLRERAEAVIVVQLERPGVVAAMNAGIEASSGDVVALTDDDAAPHAGWLARIVQTYASEEDLAAVGGRDWIYKQGQLRDGAERVVGTISRFGHVTGNHHLGVGLAREVDILKGANLSVRGDLLRGIGIDERLRGVGTEHHWELGLCLSLRRRGLRVIYDPEIGVDHFPQPRIDDSRRFSSRELADATHNKTVAILEHLPTWRAAVYLGWAFAVGTSSSPGVAQLLRSLRGRRVEALSLFWGAQWGLVLALRTYRRSRRAHRSPAQVT